MSWNCVHSACVSKTVVNIMLLRVELLHSKLPTPAKALRSLILEGISTVELTACSRRIFAEWMKSLLQYQATVTASSRPLNHAASICQSTVYLHEKPGLHSARHHVACHEVLGSPPVHAGATRAC